MQAVDTIANTYLIDQLNSTDVQTQLGKLPEWLQERARSVQQLVDELNTLEPILSDATGFFGIGAKIKMPRSQYNIYRDRVREIKMQLAGLRRIIEAVGLGYEPYSVPSNWYGGSFDNTTEDTMALEFKAPIPPSVILKYNIAKKQELFSCFIIASPDVSLFRQVSSINCDPVLVGYIQTGTKKAVVYNRGRDYESLIDRQGVVANVPGFLIAHWDLSKDLEFLK